MKNRGVHNMNKKILIVDDDVAMVDSMKFF